VHLIDKKYHPIPLKEAMAVGLAWMHNAIFSYVKKRNSALMTLLHVCMDLMDPLTSKLGGQRDNSLDTEVNIKKKNLFCLPFPTYFTLHIEQVYFLTNKKLIL
jgi:hypothetical protein